MSELRTVWQEAIANDTPGVPMGKVLDRLEQKYQAMVDLGRS
jgi:hypothetical protein